MKISVAMCTYNGAKYLQEQLDSIAAQSRLPDLLVVCDDCSDDDTPAIIERFAAAAPFEVNIQRNAQNLGLLQNFEKAISLCTGDAIALCDQDDVWLPQKLQRIESVFEERENVGLVFGDAVLTTPDGTPMPKRLWHYTFDRKDQRRFRDGDAISVLLRYNVVTGATAAFRTKFRDAFLPIPVLPEFIHDAWISLVIATSAELHFIEEPLIRYRQHSEQQAGLILSRSTDPIKSRHGDYIRSRQLAVGRMGEIKRILTDRRALLGDGGSDANFTALMAAIDREIDFTEELIKHYEARRAYPDSRIGRIGPIATEYRTRRYGRFSKGFLSAVIDLFRR